MIRRIGLAALLALASAPVVPAAAQAWQEQRVPPLAGTRLDVAATGEVIRVPDIVRIQAGVHTRVVSAGDALRQNQAKLERVRAALARAGIADRDVQTLGLSLRAIYPNTNYGQNDVLAPPAAYVASNVLLIRFRDVAIASRVLDALVAEGVTEIQGPMLEFENPGPAQDEARTLAVRNARAQADLYARALGTRVRRVVTVNEAELQRGDEGSSYANVQMDSRPGSTIDPGGRRIMVRVYVVFELE